MVSSLVTIITNEVLPIDSGKIVIWAYSFVQMKFFFNKLDDNNDTREVLYAT